MVYCEKNFMTTSCSRRWENKNMLLNLVFALTLMLFASVFLSLLISLVTCHDFSAFRDRQFMIIFIISTIAFSVSWHYEFKPHKIGVCYNVSCK